MKALSRMHPLPSSAVLISSPQKLVQLLKDPKHPDAFFYNAFETTLLYGVPLWAKALQQQENMSCIFALNVNQYPGYFFAGIRLGLRYFVCHEALKNKEKLQIFAQKRDGDMWLYP